MIRIFKASIYFIAAACIPFASAYEPTPNKIRTLYSGLNPKSIAQYLAFYELYHDKNEGKKALQEVWALISRENGESCSASYIALNGVTSAIVALVNKQSNQAPNLTEGELEFIESIASQLPNRKLRGYKAKSEWEVLNLAPEEIDLARGLFLSQLGNSQEALHTIRCYEATIDMLALQIAAKLPRHAAPEAKIAMVNHFIFTELGYRFPPQSIYSKEIDLYTFLPSVLDSRRGVCLGISLLYLTLAQRLDLPLEIVTPPGHIYVRYRGNNGIINIETTARGIHIDCKEYLSIDNFGLEERNIKEAIGLAHFNQASIFLQKQDFLKAIEAYEQAQKYMPEDPLLMELMGTCCILTEQEPRGKELLLEALKRPSKCSIETNSFTEDYLQGKTDLEGIKALFIPVDEKRNSIIKKQNELQEVVKRKPYFRDALFALITTWIQLHRLNEALHLLEKYHEIDPNDPKAEYYLAALYTERFNYPQAWKHLKNSEKIIAPHNFKPKALKELRNELSLLSPENL